MCVLGGGYIGSELAFFFYEMGVKVTILDSKPNLADREDEEVAEEFMKIFTSIIDVKSGVKMVLAWAPDRDLHTRECVLN
jgi:pyruvate/2-oxoglutarate dehydrogenase complex dihydrolipoamide dehydrogenase (E3) component